MSQNTPVCYKPCRVTRPMFLIRCHLCASLTFPLACHCFHTEQAMLVTACDGEEGLGQMANVLLRSLELQCRHLPPADGKPQLRRSCRKPEDQNSGTHVKQRNPNVEKIPQVAKDRHRRQFPTGRCDTPFSCSMDGEKSAAPRHWSQANRREHPKSPQFRATSTSTLPERSTSLVPTSRKVLRRRVDHVIRRRWV